jgi:CBS domain-containing protein
LIGAVVGWQDLAVPQGNTVFYSVPVCGNTIRIKRTENLTIQINLQSDTVENALADNAVVVGPSATLSEVLSLMKGQGVGSVLVCKERKLVGIFTERDALKTMVEKVDLDSPISDLMITEVLTIAEGAPLANAIRLMAKGKCRRLPIVDATGKLVGIVKVSGILNYFIEHFPEKVFNLPPEPNVVMPEREGA